MGFPLCARSLIRLWIWRDWIARGHECQSVAAGVVPTERTEALILPLAQKARPMAPAEPGSAVNEVGPGSPETPGEFVYRYFTISYGESTQCCGSASHLVAFPPGRDRRDFPGETDEPQRLTAQGKKYAVRSRSYQPDQTIERTPRISGVSRSRQDLDRAREEADRGVSMHSVTTMAPMARSSCACVTRHGPV